MAITFVIFNTNKHALRRVQDGPYPVLYLVDQPGGGSSSSAPGLAAAHEDGIERGVVGDARRELWAEAR